MHSELPTLQHVVESHVSLILSWYYACRFLDYLRYTPNAHSGANYFLGSIVRVPRDGRFGSAKVDLALDSGYTTIWIRCIFFN